MISNNFPRIGETQEVGTLTISDLNSCGCPRREQPPMPPTKLPFPATENNRLRLQEYLSRLYKASTFNTCEHQPLPLMKGPPMSLMIDKDAEPIAHHTPIPVPLHTGGTKLKPA